MSTCLIFKFHSCTPQSSTSFCFYPFAENAWLNFTISSWCRLANSAHFIETGFCVLNLTQWSPCYIPSDLAWFCRLRGEVLGYKHRQFTWIKQCFVKLQTNILPSSLSHSLLQKSNNNPYEFPNFGFIWMHHWEQPECSHIQQFSHTICILAWGRQLPLWCSQNISHYLLALCFVNQSLWYASSCDIP